jgi:hypothetical protein
VLNFENEPILTEDCPKQWHTQCNSNDDTPI